MSYRVLRERVLTPLCVPLAGAVLAAAPAFADDSSGNWETPRTAHGYPDLEGYWTNATLTQFERPEAYGDRLVMTEDEVRAVEQAEGELAAKDSRPTNPDFTVEDLPEDCGRGFTGVNCGYNYFWIDPGTRVMRIDGEPRTSMIRYPEDGRVPALTPQARQRRRERFARYRNNDSAGPEVRSLGERCILSFGSSAGPPMTPLLYNNHYQIVQTEDHVMILVEMVHDARIIRLNDEHIPEHIDLWMGDSVGRYEGDTLVVETTNIRPEQSFRGASENVTVIERFTRASPHQIKYEFTIDDPDAFTQVWGGEIAFNRTDEPVYEYACHEGNYALPGILAGARKQEREAAAQASDGE